MIVTQSREMQDLIELTKQAGESSASILLSGESGTGKELFAQLIHDASDRSSKPFVRLNSAALPQQLIESELFGHEKGSFTDAVSRRVGKFELASGGSLLLDEVSEMPITSQATLLRVLESGEFERVGGSESIAHNVRIIASTNRELKNEINDGTFRLDLYHRLNVIEIKIPALRDRKGDVPLLANHFLDRFRPESRFAIQGFTPESIEVMSEYSWPGNVRELRNVVHRACALAKRDTLGLSDLPDFANSSEPSRKIASASPRGNQTVAADQPSDVAEAEQIPERWLNSHLAETERAIILAAIERFGSHRVVAEQLGVSTRTLSNKIRLYRDGHVSAGSDSKAA